MVTKCGRLMWFEHVERKDYDDWVKQCMSVEIEETRWNRQLRSRQWALVKYEELWPFQ